ncbi:immunoglobulin domain-containing protein [Emticicia aquatilis]|uniref:immunoglobulin domain-containing protein n=1 Tax=Emticicia aquatilis TaxID=1537369 RepID=UPI001668D48C|nr:3-coathanger stack domain-containing protein [Emticicia aquatilis]
MKTNFTKNFFGIFTILCLLLNFHTGFSQWVQPLGINGAVGALKVTSSGGSVAGNNTYYGSAYFGTKDVIQAANNGWITSTFNAIGPGLRFKASAGKPVTITIDIAINSFGEITNYTSLSGGIGKNEQNYAYDAYVNIPFTNFSNDPRIYTYTGTFTFTNARPEAWLVFGFEILQNGGLQQYTMVLPFIVDGVKEPNVPLVMNGSVPRIITQPELPVTVLHAPPGDQSYTKFEINKTACQSVENSITEDLANSGNGSVKLGYKGSVGFIAQVDIEAYVEFTGSGTEGNSSVKIKNNETCISSTTGFGATPGSGEDIFLCEGLDYNYAVYEQLFINPATNYSTYTKSGLVMVPVDGSKRLNLFTRTNIIDQIELRRLDTLNTSLPLKQRIDAKNQLNIWKQLITLNDANVANATIPNPDYGLINLNGGAPYLDRTTSVSTNQINTLIVDHYIESNAGLQAVVNIGGSGFSGGYNLRTSKRYGQTNSTTSSNTQIMTMHLEDNDAGDLLNINIYRDPMFGTPLFKLQAGSKTSCPYEGGYQRDQPRLEIIGSNQNNITIPNVTLGTPASFQVKLCNNNTTEARTYNLGFVPQTNLNDLLISAAGSSGSQFGPFTVPANSCRVENYDVNIARRFPASGVNFSNLELEFYAACEPTIKSSIIANVSFAAPPAAVVTTNNTTVCSGSPVTLTATCPVNYAINWYTSFTGGFVVASGSSVSLSPTANTVYYVGCESTNHVPPRVASKLVLVGSPSTVLNLTSNLTTDSFQIANTTITANNKIFSPASVTYKAGSSLTFNPGFEAKSGSNFMARIGGCN